MGRLRSDARNALALVFGVSVVALGTVGCGPSGDAAVVLEGGPLVLRESGETGVLTVALGSAPRGAVTVTLSSPDASEALLSSAAATTPAATVALAFTAQNWETPQTVTVTAQDDDVADGTQTLLVQTAVDAGGDTSGYAELTELPSATVVVIDDDQPGVVVTPASVSVSEASGTASFEVRLAKEPNDAVGVALESTLVRARLSSAATTTPAAALTLSFTASDWSTAQTVTVHGVDDALAGGVETGWVRTSIVAGATADTTGYAALSAGAIEDVEVALTDDEILYVDQTATGKADGSSWQDAFLTVQAALAAAKAGQQIWVAAGVYRPLVAGADVSITMKAHVALYGGFVGVERLLSERVLGQVETVLSGDSDGLDDPGNLTLNRDDNAKTVLVGASSARLDGFTVTGGGGPLPFVPAGAGMFNDKVVNLEVENVRFVQNHAGSVGGAGMRNTDSTVALTGVTFDSNTLSTGNGAGVYNTNSTVTLTSVMFVSNTAANAGGGMYSDVQETTTYPVTTLTGVSFVANSAATGGGGLVIYGWSLITMTDVTFDSNVTTNGIGGGLLLQNSAPQNSPWTMTDVRFIANRSSGSSGGAGGGAYINALSSQGTLTRVRFIGNRAERPTAARGGGLVIVAPFTMTDATFVSNVASASPSTRGGGMYAAAPLTMTGVTFVSNTASGGNGGGLALQDTELKSLTGVTFAHNSATSGGGLHSDSGTGLTLTNCVFGGHGGDDIVNPGTTTYTCAEQDLTGVDASNQQLAANPFDVVTASGEAFLDQYVTGCVDLGSDAAANAAETGFAALGLPHWYETTTSSTGSPLDLDATAGEATNDVDMGRHYAPSAARIETLTASASDVSWTTHNAASCELSNSADATVVTVAGASLASGSQSHSWATGTVAHLRCSNGAGEPTFAVTAVP